MTEVKGELTADLALKLTFIMWEDMAEAEKRLGRIFTGFERYKFKWNWLVDRGFAVSIMHGVDECNVCCCCLLCEYVERKRCGCVSCLVDWSANCSGTCCAQGQDNIDYERTPAAEFVEYMKTHVRKDVN